MNIAKIIYRKIKLQSLQLKYLKGDPLHFDDPKNNPRYKEQKQVMKYMLKPNILFSKKTNPHKNKQKNFNQKELENQARRKSASVQNEELYQMYLDKYITTLKKDKEKKNEGKK